ncbi:unnamed protein product [Linum trigynum]|uniref:Uncharacterized protein n=1 Tax=Linum trigynum TaxID=586398 RepID=A0AAV2GK05_9ROSI
MQTTLLPISICDEIDKRIRRFIWGSTTNKRRVHLVHWEQVCQPKEKGGLGLKKAHELNLAFLAKLAWCFLKNIDDLWVKVIEAKYFKLAGGVLTPKSVARCLTLWWGMRRSWPLMQEGMAMCVKDDRSTAFWTDRWLDPALTLIDHIRGDSQLVDPTIPITAAFEESGKWNENFLLSCLPREIALQVLASPAPREEAGEDEAFWGPKANGQFCVKSAYEIAIGQADTGQSLD